MEAKADIMKRQKELLKAIHCFKGPVHHAFVYTYYQTYTQHVDMYNYAVSTNKCLQFTSKEFLILEHERRPCKLNFFLLFKVIQNCCNPVLAESNDDVWSFNSDTCCNENKVEQILASLVNTYRNFLHNANRLSTDEMIEKLCCNVTFLIEKSAEFSNSKRWTEERDNLQKMFSNIAVGNLMYSSGNITDIIKVEAEFRTDLYEELLSKELTNVDMCSWHLQLCSDVDEDSNTDDSASRKDENIEAGDILKIMSAEQKRICWICGEHGVGKSTLATLIATGWAQKCKEIHLLKNMSAVFVVSLTSVDFIDEDDILNVIVPLTSLMLSVERLHSWIAEEAFLIVLDDVKKHNENLINFIYKSLECFPNMIVLCLGRVSSLYNYINNAKYTSEALMLVLKGLKEEKVLTLSKNMVGADEDTSLRTKLKRNMNRLGYVLKYPSIAFMTFKLWLENSSAFNNIYTASDLMWEILHWEVKQILKINIKKVGPARKKFFGWLMLAGELALYSLKADLRLDKQSLEELEAEIVSLYKDNGKTFLNSFFQPSICHSYASCFTITGSRSKPFLEYLSSWFFIDQLMQNKQMSQLTSGLVNQLPLILFSAGHLERFQDEGSITIPEERKVIRALVRYREDSYEDFFFIQKFVAELKCIKRLVEIVIDETEYNEEWNLNLSEIQQKSLEVLLNHVSPTRLIILADESKKNYEMSDVMKFICRVNISVWLDSAPQFTYGNTQNLDKLLQPFLAELVHPRVDLISGSLTLPMLNELHKFRSTQHLVFLRLKVSTNQHLSNALNAPKQLPHLLWLELKVDMKFSDINIADAEHSNRLSLFDIHLRHINENEVTFLADLLTAMQSRYTGIHLEETTLTPEGVFTLLTDLSKRGVTLHGDEESIMKFRMWYYPSLSSLPKWKIPSEEECMKLIGHDDREFFSDHHVTSSRFVRSIDAWNLRNYLETQKNINHFVYEASNITFKKCLDGHVKIKFKGEYKETIEDKVLDSGCKIGAENEIENHVLEFF